MTLGLGATTFVVFESLFNRNMGVVAGITFAAVAFSFLAWPCSQDQTHESDASIRKTNAAEEQDRAITDRGQGHHSGAQALLGFQFVGFSCGLLAGCRVGLKSPMPSRWQPLPCRSFC
jgi:hypothetical protein